MYNSHMLCEIIENREVAPSVYRLTVRAEGLAASAAPGQFALVACGGGTYLGRPFGFCDADAACGTVTFMYQVRGAGTLALTDRRPGERVDVLGPLGNGFALSCGKAAIVGGGAGVFPLLFLARRLAERGVTPGVFLGFRNRASALLTGDFERYAGGCEVVSDDGSTGKAGFVTRAFSDVLDRGAAYDAVYACGPEPMLRETARLCAERGLVAQLSMEQRMGCGIGACLVCACAVKARDAAAGGDYTYARVCKDGPVFMSDAVIFESE